MQLPIKVEGIMFARNKNKIEYLLLKRIKEDGGFWQPMTGTLNDGERLKDCLLRELGEETGITKYKQIIDNVDVFEWENSEKKTITEYVFGIQIERTKIKLSKEHDEFGWYDFNESIRKLEKQNNKRSLTMLNSKLKGDN